MRRLQHQEPISDEVGMLADQGSHKVDLSSAKIAGCRNSLT